MLKQYFFAGNVGEGSVWFYPWWAYGVADTRYLTHSGLIVAVSGMDAAAALVKLGVIYFYYKGYRAFSSLMGILVAVCMLWGQYYFFVSETYNRFAAVGDGWFGHWVKFFGLSCWWLFFPAFAIIGFVWELAMN